MEFKGYKRDDGRYGSATTRAEVNKSRPFNCLKQGPSF